MTRCSARIRGWAGLLSVILLHAGQVWAVESSGIVTVTPNETDEILANPGMGWETFHYTAIQDKNLPTWIPSTVHYARWSWETLEPEKGKIDYDFLDGVLKETHEAGQKLAFRAMCCSSSPRRPYHPEWLRDIGGKVVVTRYGDGPELEVPVLVGNLLGYAQVGGRELVAAIHLQLRFGPARVGDQQ